MILQSLVNYYEALSETGKMPILGWAPVKVSYALDLNDDGEIKNVITLKIMDEKGKKTHPQELILPSPVKRSSGVSANFLCDNSSYLLGIDLKGKPGRSKECFNAAAILHERLLSTCDEPAAKALLKHFKKWNTDGLSSLIPDEERRNDILSGGNILFLYKGQYLQEMEPIRQVWQDNYSASDGEKKVCLVTGRKTVPAVLHPNIKGVPGAQSSGASLVSFNAPSFCSYGHEQGLNAPTSEYAAFAYGTALNYLIATQHTRIGDTAVLFWSENAKEQYRTIMDYCCWGNVPEQYKQEDLTRVVDSICHGRTSEFDETMMDPSMQFYLLGISPNAARLSVRFFLKNSFGQFLKNINEHQSRLSIAKPEKYQFGAIPLWRILGETVNQNSRDKNPNPNMAGAVLNSILNNTQYPAMLLNAIELRIRADRQINTIRAGIIKAYYMKAQNPEVSEEVLQMSLNPECNDTAYVLGRLFSVLENIQNAANPGINTTIRDKYFNSACATPAVVFPTLINLSQKHLKKIDGGLKVTLDKQLTELLGKLDTVYPAHLSLPQQGSFQLGYYHQNVARYTKKEEK